MFVSAIKELDVTTLNPPPNVTVVTDPSGLQKIDEFFSRVDTFGVDVETNVTDSFLDRKLRTIQVGTRDEQYIIDLLAFAGSTEKLLEQGWMKAPDWAVPIVECLKKAFDSNKWLKVGVYLQFDYEAILWCLGLYTWHLYDCMLAEKALNAGKVPFYTEGYYSMLGMCKKYLKIEIDKALQTSFDLSTKLTEEQIIYASLDTRLPLAIRKAQTPAVVGNELELCIKIENDAIPAFGDMHLYGFKLDADKWLALNAKNKERHAENIKALDKFFLNIVGHKNRTFCNLKDLEDAWRNEKDKAKRAAALKAYREEAKKQREFKKAAESFQGEAAINYEATPQILAALRKAGFGERKLPNTSNDALKKLAPDNPIIAALINYRASAIQLKTFGESFVEKYINPVTKRIHSEIDQYGAATGRTSSSKPNIQNIPKEAEWRKCFVPEHGWTLITSDYSGCELRILAEVSGEKAWVDAFNNGWDVHSVGAEILFGEEWAKSADGGCAYIKAHQKCKCKKHKVLRDKVKAINFGIAYGMEAAKLANDLGISLDEATHLLKKYRETFKSVTAWLGKAGNMAKLQLMCRTLSGRIRWFERPSWETAHRLAEERASKDKRPLHPNDVSRTYYSMYGNIEREGKNTPIQGTNADMVKLAVGCGFDSDGKPYMWHRLREFSAKLVNIVHDEVVVEVKKELAEELKDIVGDCMSRAGGVFVKSIPMAYEATIADEWSKG